MTNPFRVASFAVALALTTAPAALAADSVGFVTLAQVDADNVALFVDTETTLPDVGALMNDTDIAALKRAMAGSGFDGTFGAQKTFYGIGTFKAVTVIGTGDEPLSRRQLHDLGGHTSNVPGDETLAVILGELDTTATRPGAEIALGYGLGDYSFRTYKTGMTGVKGEVSPPNDDRKVMIVGTDADADRAMMERDYDALVAGVTLTRDMGTEPGMAIYPESFVSRVRAEARGISNLRVTVLELRDLQREGMGGILGVGQGSVHDPRLMILDYRGGDAGDAPIALVGKGITFDTGGISLKPNTGQWLMKSDLSGAAAVAGTVLATAKRGADVNVVGVMPLAENMPGSRAIRPGDVLTTYNGTTIEVMSTDAEGRLLLADAVAYAQDKYDPELLINIATLTGSAARAMGDEYGAMITRDWDLAETMMDVGARAGEDVWPLPLHPNHFKQIHSDIADIKSTAGNPGASIGAAVVGTFVDDDQPWVHLDIAGVDWLDSGTPTTPKGHAGWGVRFMDQVIRDHEAGK
ncbi:M17 family metallopeptidase [Algimonas porphyrae]|uniref:Cytosol aminopeptidase n=1 Tax=Algimonas porphyrae TaxID=1128113 RepID=A0ABQ5V0I5_9PROT|nr:leucyl aminopeptidase family protein [Algimonas porphyrae]GLQ20938.1 putative cytosol aminopeptidase [Algimonas porphyrae]